MGPEARQPGLAAPRQGRRIGEVAVKDGMVRRPASGATRRAGCGADCGRAAGPGPPGSFGGDHPLGGAAHHPGLALPALPGTDAARHAREVSHLGPMGPGSGMRAKVSEPVRSGRPRRAPGAARRRPNGPRACRARPRPRRSRAGRRGRARRSGSVRSPWPPRRRERAGSPQAEATDSEIVGRMRAPPGSIAWRPTSHGAGERGLDRSLDRAEGGMARTDPAYVID